MTDFLGKKQGEIEARMRELKPMVDEYNQLEAASAALAAVGNGGSSPARGGRPANGRRRPGRPPGTSGRARSTATTARGSRARGRRGRPRGSGTRAIQALELVKGQPGITIPELAQRMGIKQNYLYRVLPGLQASGQVRKQGRGWHAKSA